MLRRGGRCRAIVYTSKLFDPGDHNGYNTCIELENLQNSYKLVIFGHPGQCERLANDILDQTEQYDLDLVKKQYYLYKIFDRLL